MKSKFLLCIDDADKPGGEVSTSSLAEKIAAFADSFAPASFVTHYRLLPGPRINRTLSNSCMCLEAELNEERSALDFVLKLLTQKVCKTAENCANFKLDNDKEDAINGSGRIFLCAAADGFRFGGWTYLKRAVSDMAASVYCLCFCVTRSAAFIRMRQVVGANGRQIF